MGVYRKEAGTGKPISIEISTRGDSPELTFAHEVGHFLEGAAIPGSSFGVRQWAFDEFAKDWQTAVKRSETWRILSEILASKIVVVVDPSGHKAERPTMTSYVTYLLSTEELWARSYAQYVASRGRSEVLLDQIRTRRYPVAAFPLQWGDDEFEPIARKFDNLFRKIGWGP